MKRSLEHVTKNAEGNLSVPPGFESLTTLKFKRIASGAVEGEPEPGVVGALISNSDIERFKASFMQRPWISHVQSQRVQHQDDSDQIGVNLKDTNESLLPKGVIRGCPDCDDCVKVTARWHPEESYLPELLDDAPVFRPTEEEFKDTLKYISNIRPRAENYGICRIVPPCSWRPPFLLKNKEIWETSKFRTYVQKIDGLRNLFYKKIRSRLRENIKTGMPKDAENVELVSRNECVGDLEDAKPNDLVSDFESGPEFTLKSLKKYADDFKVQYFRENDTATAAGINQREPLIARIESEYWRIVDKPSEEIEVLFGAALANQIQTLSSGFPTASTQVKGMGGKCNEYVECGWNLNNTPDLYGSLLRFGRHNSSTVSVPQMFIGMCFASQCWRTEDHHLYSLSYMHMGSPKVWYSIPGKYCLKFVELLKKRFPKLSKHPKLLHELVAQLSPSLLKSEGIPVYRCVQNPLEFVVTFPGAYHSEVSCGFNCSEAVCFAPLHWLLHGQNIVEVYAGNCFKTSLSHDKLLLGAAMEAAASLWDSYINKTDSSGTRLWKRVSGKNGILTRFLKLRVESEGTRRKHLCNASMCSVLDESKDAMTKRECCVCLYDLYLSSVACSCSPNRYTCLRHVKQLCSCGWNSKRFLLRFQITELNLLLEALEGNVKALHTWAKGRREKPYAISSKGTNGLASRNMANGVVRSATAANSSTRPSGRIRSEKSANGDDVVILLSDEED